jgi:hypothetical protein
MNDTRHSSPVRAAVDKVGHALESRGFEAREEQAFTRRVGPDALAWVGLNTVQKDDGSVDLYPFVGVRHEQVEDVLASVLQTRLLAHMPTVRVHLGCLMPESTPRSWHLDSDDPDKVAEDLASAVTEYAIPFAEGLRDLDSLEQALHDYGDKLGRELRLPIIAALRGDRAAAEVAAARIADPEPGDRTSAARERRRFARGFSAWLAGGKQ